MCVRKESGIARRSSNYQLQTDTYTQKHTDKQTQMRWLVIMSNTDHHSFAGRGGDRGGGGDDGYRRFIDPPDSLSQFQTMSSSTALDSTG